MFDPYREELTSAHRKIQELESKLAGQKQPTRWSKLWKQEKKDWKDTWQKIRANKYGIESLWVAASRLIAFVGIIGYVLLLTWATATEDIADRAMYQIKTEAPCIQYCRTYHQSSLEQSLLLEDSSSLCVCRDSATVRFGKNVIISR